MKEIVLCFLFMSVIRCNMIKVYDSSSPKHPSFHIHARKLLELCYPNDLNPVVISVDLTDLMFELQKNEAINSSVLVIDKNFNSGIMKKYHPRHPTYLITANSIDTLNDTIFKMKSSKIWSTTSVIVAIGKKCNRAAEILRVVWKIEALSSFYVCPHEFTGESFIFTFNPFTPRASESWTQVEGQQGERWTLYTQRFQNNESICSSITYDKSRSLDGFPLKGLTFSKADDHLFSGKFPPNVSSVLSLSEQFIYDELFEAVNVTPIIQIRNSNKINLSQDFKEDMFDIYLTLLHFGNKSIFDITPLYIQAGTRIITRKQNTIPILTEVTDSFFTHQTIVIGGFTLVMIFLMIFFNYQYDFGGAVLDILSFILGMGISTPINRLFMRVTFFTAMLFNFYFCPELQSKFTSVLTSPGARKNIETLYELRDNQYKLFYHPFAKPNLRNSKIWENLTFNSSQNLIRSVELCENRIRNNKGACILPDYLDNLTIEGFHVSKESVFKHYRFLSLRQYSPLKKKIDETAMMLAETGFVDYLDRKNPLKWKLKRQKLIDRIEALEREEFLDLADFSTFLWGFTCVVSFSFFIFSIELIMNRIKRFKLKKNRELD